MKEFLQWQQVQRQLTEYFQKTGEFSGFYDATRDLWEAGMSTFAEEFPKISFEQ